MTPDDSERLFRTYLSRPTRRRLARVVRAYHAHVWRVALRATGRRQDAEDISQDVFLRLLLDPPQPDTVRSADAYLAWQVIGRVTNLRRAEERRRKRERRGGRLARGDGLDPEDVTILRTAVSELDEELRAVVELRYFAGLCNRGIGTILGVSERTVERRLSRAKELLRKRLRPSVFGLLSLYGTKGLGTQAPPPRLLPRLERLVQGGPALSLAPAVGSTGAVMTKKACVIVGLLLLMTLIALVPLLLDRGTAPGISPGQREPVPHDVAVEGHPVCRAEAPEPTSKERREAAQPPPPRMILQGVVHDTLGNRVEGVRVTLTADLSEQRTEEMGRLGYQEVASGALTHEAVSDASGEFSVEGLLPIEYRGTIEKEGFLLLMPPKNPFRLRRDPGEERALEVLLCRAFRLHGTVLSADGVPIEGAEVLLDLDTARHVDGLGEAAGRLRVPVDPRGHYDTGPRMILAKYRTWEPAAWAPGHAVAYAGRIERDDAVGYDVEVDFALKLEARVEVFVEDPDGFPVEGAIVQGGALPGLASRTNPQGRALLDRLEPGERTVHVSKKGYFDEELSFDAGKERTVSVVLRRQGLPIEGSIVFDERLPQALRTVEKIHLVQRKPSGEVEGLVHGPVVLDQKERSFAFRPPPGWHYQVACRVGLREFGSEIVWYSGDETVRVDVHVLPEPPLVSGRVVDAQTGKPVGGATVVCRSSRRSAGGLSTWGRYRIFNGFHVPGMAGNATATTTDEEGHFLYLAPTRPVHGHGDERWGPIEGIATLYAVREGASVRTQGIPLSEPAVVEFDASTAVTDVVLEIMSPGSMEGRVVDAGGRPAVDEVVVAWDGLGTICATECDKEGRYRFEGLRPGRYLLVPVGRRSRSVPWGMGVGGGNRREGLPPPHEFFEFPVEVRPRETARYDMDLRRDALGAVEGTVSGVPGGGERVVIGMIINGEGRPYPPLGGRTIPKRGRFRFDNLLPGRYLVWIERDGIRLGETEVEIHASRQLQIDMPVEEATGSPRE